MRSRRESGKGRKKPTTYKTDDWRFFLQDIKTQVQAQMKPDENEVQKWQAQRELDEAVTSDPQLMAHLEAEQRRLDDETMRHSLEAEQAAAQQQYQEGHRKREVTVEGDGRLDRRESGSSSCYGTFDDAVRTPTTTTPTVFVPPPIPLASSTPVGVNADNGSNKSSNESPIFAPSATPSNSTTIASLKLPLSRKASAMSSGCPTPVGYHGSINGPQLSSRRRIGGEDFGGEELMPVVSLDLHSSCPATSQQPTEGRPQKRPPLA